MLRSALCPSFVVSAPFFFFFFSRSESDRPSIRLCLPLSQERLVCVFSGGSLHVAPIYATRLPAHRSTRRRDGACPQLGRCSRCIYMTSSKLRCLWLASIVRLAQSCPSAILWSLELFNSFLRLCFFGLLLPVPLRSPDAESERQQGEFEI
jgi:hypothetical protein